MKHPEIYPSSGQEILNFRKVRKIIILAMICTTLACPVIAAIACKPVPVALNASPEISAHCNLPANRSLDVAIGGMEPIPGRQIHVFEIFSFPNNGINPLDDLHIQIWWESTNENISIPSDMPPIIHFGSNVNK